MAVKIRLARRGRKKQPFFHIVVADTRSPRDGRYIEKLGYYNPTTNPVTLQLDSDRALQWLRDGAQTSGTTRSLLSGEGVLFRKHLLGGVAKNAMTQEQADKKFNDWIVEKQHKIDTAREKLARSNKEEKEKRLSAERERKEAVAKKILLKKSPLATEAPVATTETAMPTQTSSAMADKATETPAATISVPATEPLPAATIESVAEPIKEPIAETKVEPATSQAAEHAPEAVTEPTKTE